MYAIGNIVYGVSLKSFYSFDFVTPEQREAIERASNDELIHTEYNGSGDEPCFVGPILDSLDACDDQIVSNLKLSPTPEQIETFKTEVETLVEQYPILDGLFNNPIVFITWGSS